MTAEQDRAIWNNLGVADFGFEDIAPLRVIAEAIQERCAVALPHNITQNSVQFSGSFFAKLTEWPNVELYEAIYEKIRELIPYFIIMDGNMQLNQALAGVPLNEYTLRQYSNFPLYRSSDYAKLPGVNISDYPREMVGVDNAQKLNVWYGACKFWLQQMKAVDVSRYAYLYNQYSFGGSYVYGADAGGRITDSGGDINGTDIESLSSMEDLFDYAPLSSIEVNLSGDNITLAMASWHSMYSYHYSQWIDEYRISGTWDWDVGTAKQINGTYTAIDYPGRVRIQNPAVLSGDLHLVLKPNARMYYIERTPEIVSATYEDSDWPGYPWITVHRDIQTAYTRRAYSLLSGSIFSEDTFKLIESNSMPGQYPKDLSDTFTTTYYYNNFDGSPLTTSVDIEIEESDNVHYGAICSKDWEYNIADGGSFWQKGVHDKNIGPIGAYSIKDQIIFMSSEKPGWWNYLEEDIESKVTHYNYWNYYNDVDLDVNCQQKAVAYIDYSPSFKYM